MGREGTRGTLKSLDSAQAILCNGDDNDDAGGGCGDVGVDEPEPYSAKQQVLMRRRQVKRLRRRKKCRFLEKLHSLSS